MTNSLQDFFINASSSIPLRLFQVHTRRHARPIGLLIRRKKELTLTADTVRERFSLPLIDMVAGAEVSSLCTLITGYHQILVNQWDVYKDSIRYTLWSICLARVALRFHQRARDIPTFVARHCPFCVKSVCGHLLRRSLVFFSKAVEEHKEHLRVARCNFFFFYGTSFSWTCTQPRWYPPKPRHGQGGYDMV